VKVKGHKKSELEKFLTRDELSKIFSSFTYENHHNYAHRNKSIWELLLNTGLRVSEASALLISDVINISGQVKDVLLVRAETAKRKKSRLVPLNNTAKQAIQALMQGKDPEFNDPLMTHLNTKKPLGKRALQDIIYLTCEKAGIRKISIHMLRHTFLSSVYRITKNAKTTAQLAGHANISLTLGLYCHSSLDELVDATNLIEDGGCQKPKT
jgi:integrase/recombinase XerD